MLDCSSSCCIFPPDKSAQTTSFVPGSLPPQWQCFFQCFDVVTNFLLTTDGVLSPGSKLLFYFIMEGLSSFCHSGLSFCNKALAWTQNHFLLYNSWDWSPWEQAFYLVLFSISALTHRWHLWLLGFQNHCWRKECPDLGLLVWMWEPPGNWLCSLVLSAIILLPSCFVK